MYFEDYINPQYTAYLNRHLTGIIKLKDKIQEISVYYEFSEAIFNESSEKDSIFHNYDSRACSSNRRLNIIQKQSKTKARKHKSPHK